MVSGSEGPLTTQLCHSEGPLVGREPSVRISPLALASTASAQQQSPISNDNLTAGLLYKACLLSDATGSNDQLCNMYFRGLTDGLYIMQEMSRGGKPTCMSDDTPISVPDARRFFNAWMTTHTDAASHSAGLIAAFAVFNAFPCQKPH
ncbi:MAG: Rap1a/Tai family immunity protein [Stellaceae bacterium]